MYIPAPKRRKPTIEPPKRLSMNKRAVIKRNRYHFRPFDFTLITTQDRNSTIRLARVCKITHSLKQFHVPLPRIYELNFCNLLWDQNTVLLFSHNNLHAINLQTLQHEVIETASMQPLGSMQQYEVEWSCSAVDPTNGCIYVQCRFNDRSGRINYDIYRLQWDTKQWTKLALVAHQGRRMIKGTFMAFWEDQLYMGIQDRESVTRIDLTTLHMAVHPIEPCIKNGKTIRFTTRYSIEWAQVGPSMYCVCSHELTSSSAQNDLWAIDLPSLTWIRHKELKDLQQNMLSFVVCSSTEELWVLKKQDRFTGFQIVAYQVPLSLPKLQILARNAFFHRPPTGLLYPMRFKTRQKEKKLEENKQNFTVQTVKDFLRGHQYHLEPFKFPDDNEV